MKLNRDVKDTYVIYLSDNLEQRINLVVSFDENQEMLKKLKSNEVMVVIKDTDINDISKIIGQVQQQLNKQNININKDIKIVSNHTIDVEKLNTDDFNFILQREENLDKKQSNDIKMPDIEKEDEPFEKFWKANVIKKEDNGILKSYIQRKEDSNHVGYLLDYNSVHREDLLYKFKVLSADKSFIKKIERMKEEEIAFLLLDSIAEDKNLKKYFLESNDKQASLDRKGDIASSISSKNDGLVNKELGIVQNSPSSTNMIHTVEENSDGYKVVAPDVVSDNSKTSGDSYSSVSDVSDQYSENLENNKFDYENTNDYVQSRKLETQKKVKVRTPSYMNHSSGLVSIIVILILSFIFCIGIIMIVLR